MGDPRRSRKKYETPPHPWQKVRIDREAKLLRHYGLKNKRELWRHETQLRSFRKRARMLASMTGQQAEKLKAELFGKIARIGVSKDKSPSLDDVLSLEVTDLLERRLQTQVYRIGMAYTMKQARQFITHGHISLDKRKVTVPSMLLDSGAEGRLSFAAGTGISRSHNSVPTVEKAKEIAEREKKRKAEADKAEAQNARDGGRGRRRGRRSPRRGASNA